MSEEGSATPPPQGSSVDGSCAAAASSSSEPPPHPIAAACWKMFDCFRSDNYCETLQAFEELQSMDGLIEFACSKPENKRDVCHAWGKAVIAASQMCSDDEEHLAEIVSDYEDRFGPCPYLQAMLVPAPNALDAIKGFVTENPTIPVGDLFSAIDGIFDKYSKVLSRSDAARIVAYLETMGLKPVPEETSERLQKIYVKRMKTEEAETVLHEMLADKVYPTSPYAYNFVFMKPHTAKPLMEYYEQMLDFGIKPNAVTYRILLKNPQLTKDEYGMMRRRAKGETAPEQKTMNQLRLCQAGQGQAEGQADEARKIYNRMILEGIVPDKYVFNHLILSCKGRPQQAEEWYKVMMDRGVQPNAVTFTNLITVSKDGKNPEAGDKWIQEMITRGMQVDIHNFAALLDSYVKSGSRIKAQQCFKSLLERKDCGVAVYNTVMKLGPFDWAYGCLACMLSDGLQPSAHTRSTMQGLARDPVSNEIVDELVACGWLRESILSSRALVSPAKGTIPSIQECLRFLLREVKMSDSEIAIRTDMLVTEIERCKRSTDK
jgi:pentatricopeptide repeat protein